MWCPVGYRRGYEVLEVIREHLALKADREHATAGSSLEAFELCADVLGQASSLQLAFIDGRIFQAGHSILALFQDDRTGELPGFLFLDESLEVSNRRLRRLAGHFRWQLFRLIFPWGVLREGARIVFRRPPGKHRGAMDRAAKDYWRAVGFQHWSRDIEGAAIVIAQEDFPDQRKLASLLNARSLEPPEAVKPRRKSGRPAKRTLIAQALRALSPDRPLNAAYSEIYGELKSLVGTDFSDDTYSRAKRLAWPQNDERG